MEREMILSGQIHVACDRTAFRYVLHNEPPSLDDFAKMADKNIVFSPADHAGAEIIKQLEESPSTASKYN